MQDTNILDSFVYVPQIAPLSPTYYAAILSVTIDDRFITNIGVLTSKELTYGKSNSRASSEDQKQCQLTCAEATEPLPASCHNVAPKEISSNLPVNKQIRRVY